MVSVAETKSLSKEIAELLKSATTEQKLQIKGILIGAKLVSENKYEQREESEVEA